jgi:hypothetical protein
MIDLYVDGGFVWEKGVWKGGFFLIMLEKNKSESRRVFVILFDFKFIDLLKGILGLEIRLLRFLLCFFKCFKMIFFENFILMLQKVED